MVSTDLSLPAAMRSNLLTLQAGQQQMATAQQHLATGLKVNTALDSPPVYFAAKALTQRASDLSAMKDAVGQAISTVKAGDKGAKHIGDLLAQARGLTTAALTSLGTDAGSIQTRRNLADQFDGILEQINGIAGDSGYGGKNLLVGDGSKMEAITESKLAVQDLIGIRRARVTDISEPDDYQIAITGSGRITGAVGDIANAKQNLGLAAIKVTGVQSQTSGDFNPISITVSGGPETDKVITVANPPDSFTQRFTTAQWEDADTIGTLLKFDHSFPSGARVRFDVDFDLIDATPQNVGTRTAQIEKHVDLAVAVTDSSGYTVTRDANNILGSGKLIEGENSFVFPSGTVRLIVDPKTLQSLGDESGLNNDVISTPPPPSPLTIDADGGVGPVNIIQDFNAGLNPGTLYFDVVMEGSTSGRRAQVIYDGSVVMDTGINPDSIASMSWPYPAAPTQTIQLVLDQPGIGGAGTGQWSYSLWLIPDPPPPPSPPPTPPPQQQSQPSPRVANLVTRLSSTPGQLNDLFVAFDTAHQNGITVEPQNLQVDGRGLHVDFSQNGWMDRPDIENAITGLDTAEQRVRSASQALTTGLGIITTREDFLKGFSDVLDEGASKLTLADQNEEGSNYLMLQTRQQLAQTALGLANQSQQAILSLFR